MNTRKLTSLILLLIACLLTTASASDIVTTTITLTGTRNLISLPCVPIFSSPETIFNGYVIHNNLTAWIPQNQSYNTFDIEAPEEFGGAFLGEGYWFKGNIDDVISYESFPSGLPTAGILTDAWLSLPGIDDGLNKGGRHLIGCPYNEDVSIDNIQFINGTDILPWSQANTAGWVGSSISYWTDSGYEYITCSGPNDIAFLQPGKSYWIETKIDNIVMTITAPIIAPTPATYTLSSTVLLGDYVGTIAGIPVTLDLLTENGSSTIRTESTTLDAVGRFYIHNVAPGTYYIGIKPSHWLRKVTGPVTISDNNVDFVIK